MKEAQKIVRQLNAFVKDGKPSGDLDGEALASEYARLCAAANERLSLCKGYILKGMLSEAMHVAENKPVLLDVCVELDLPESEKWGAICKKSNWAIAEQLDDKAIELLNNSYSTAMDLEPMVKNYRKAVREKDTNHCIQLLRRIIELDTDNKNWKEDLKAFEKKRVAEIGASYRKVAQNDDLDALESYMTELNSEWNTPPEEKLKESVSEAYKEVRTKKAGEQGKAIVADISEAYSSFNYAGIQALIVKYNDLLAEGYFKPDENTEIQFAEAKDWFDKETTNKANEQTYQKDLSGLKSELNKPTPSAKLEKLIMKLESHKREVPDDLMQRAYRGIETYNLMVLRKKRIVLVTTILVALIISGAVIGMIWRWQYNKEKVIWVSRLKEAYEEYNFDKFEKICADIPNYRPMLFGNFLARSKEIETWTGKTEELRDKVTARLNNFDGKKSLLKLIGDRGYKESAEKINTIVKDARNLALEPDQSAYVDRFVLAWRTYNDDKIDKLIKELRALTPSAKIFEAKPLNEAEKDIRSAKLLLDEALAIDGASPVSAQLIQPFKAEIDEITRTLESRQTALSTIEQATSASSYLTAMQSYISKFPLDHFSSVVQNAADIDTHMLDSRLEIWEQQREAMRSTSQDIRNRWDSVKNNIAEIEGDELLSDLKAYYKRDIGDNTPQPRFVKDVNTVMSGTRKVTMAKTYTPSASNRIPNFNSSVLDKNTMSSLVILGHSSLLSDILTETASVKADDSATFMLGVLQKIIDTPVLSSKNTDLDKTIINSVLKFKILRFFCEQTSLLIGSEKLPQLALFMRNSRNIDTSSVDWICIKNPLLEQIAKECEDTMKYAFADIEWMKDIRLDGLIKSAVSRRGVKWCGYVDFQNPKKINWRGDPPSEGWVIRDSDGGQEQLLIAFKKSTTENKFHSLIPLYPGEVILGPEHNSLTSKEMSWIIKESGINSEAKVSSMLPWNWPREPVQGK